MTPNEIEILLERLRRKLKIRVVMERDNAIRAEIVIDGKALSHSFVFTPEHWSKLVKDD